MWSGKWALVSPHAMFEMFVVYFRSLSHELYALFRVMWSGKWALVSPHAMLNAVWRMIPFFKGYAQQDAQEFLW